MHIHFFLMIRSKEPSKLLANPRAKGEMFRERLLLVKQRVLRNEHFCPPSIANVRYHIQLYQCMEPFTKTIIHVCLLFYNRLHLSKH